MVLQQQPSPTVENHFIAGLKTEFTGLNFPENAATDTQNCVYTLIGDVLRRNGIDFERNFVGTGLGDRTNQAIKTYKWNNAGGDGERQILVLQVGITLYFFVSTNATFTEPLSTTLISSTVNISSFTAVGNTNNIGQFECEFTDGNGYLFVFNQNCDPFYCTFVSGTVTGNKIIIKQRDFSGIQEPGVVANFRPPTLSAEHQYNLINQGWTAGTPWTANASATPGNYGPGNSITFNISSQTNTTSITNGSTVQFNNGFSGQPGGTLTGIVTSYSTPFTTLIMTITSGSMGSTSVFTGTLSLVNVGFINTWFTQVGNYPSNSDIWWLYKNTSNVFAPTTTIGNVQQPFGPASKGSFILQSFIQLRSAVSGVAGLTDIITTRRPTTGCWFQGRIWYSGIDDTWAPVGDGQFTTWTENIYFSQISVDTTTFGNCYQTNDPTNQNLFAILPSDGGVITIQGSGAIYKLFAIQNGVIVFAANGIWFITGSGGVGFSANNYSITKVSSIQSISTTSYVNVQGWPMFWNEEGIYYVTTDDQGGSVHSPDIRLKVDNLCLGTILSYYANIPLQSKKYVRGDFDPLSYVVQWCYRSTNESDITSRYQFDTILNFNLINKAFYPYTLPTVGTPTQKTPFIHAINYIAGPGGSTSPSPVFKYVTSVLDGPPISGYGWTFSEESSSNNGAVSGVPYVDWPTQITNGLNYTSYFVTGYRLTGKALTKFQTPYVYVFSRNPSGNSYGIQAIWDYAGSGLTGRWSTLQIKSNSPNNFSNMYHKIRLRGRGLALQLKVVSIANKPFDLMGWSIWNEVNVNV